LRFTWLIPHPGFAGEHSVPTFLLPRKQCPYSGTVYHKRLERYARLKLAVNVLLQRMGKY
jgi:hypothetical protein